MTSYLTLNVLLILKVELLRCIATGQDMPWPNTKLTSFKYYSSLMDNVFIYFSGGGGD